MLNVFSKSCFTFSDVFNHLLCSSTSATMLLLYVCVVFLRCCYTILIYGFVIWCVYVLYVMCFLSACVCYHVAFRFQKRTKTEKRGGTSAGDM